MNSQDKNIHRICDYIIFKIKGEEDNAPLSNIKIQKLLYYTQAWFLAFYSRPLFTGKFQAWIHGPVSREIYDRFKDKTLYSEIELEDVSNLDFSDLTDGAKAHIEEVLEVYNKYSGSELERITHQELPWISARKGYKPQDRCEVEIDEGIMASFYAERLK